MHYDHFNHNILNYYAECNVFDNDPSQKEYTTIPGIDLRTLKKDKIYYLTDNQMKKVISDIYHYDIKNASNSYYTLAVNCFSNDEEKRTFFNYL